MTLNLFDQKDTYQVTLTSFVEGFHAKHFQWQVVEEDLMTPEERSFLKLHGFLDITHKLETQYPIWYSKMLKAYLVTMVDEHFPLCTKFLPTLGIPLNTRFSILGTMASHRIGKECSLSDILETEVDRKYFLSEKSVQQLIRSKKKGMPSPVLMHPTTKEQMGKEQ